MNDIGKIFGYVAVFIGTPLVAIYLLNLGRFFKNLRERCPNVWRSMGEPSLFVRNSPASNFRFLKFILQEEYKLIDDVEIIAQARGLKRLLVALLFCFATPVFGALIFL